MTTTLGILTATPIWAWAVLGLLVWLGMVASRTRTVGLPRVLATPLVFIAWGLFSLATSKAALGPAAAAWLLAALCGGTLGLIERFDRLRFEPGRALVHVPGSWFPLIRNLSIFLAKYAIAVAMAMKPGWRDSLPFWDAAISGASAGYFVLTLIRLAVAYRRARPLPDLAAAVQPH
jgi:hypothetical protein